MVTTSVNTSSNSLTFDANAIKAKTPLQLNTENFSSQRILSESTSIQEASVTGDCLRVPIQHLSLNEFDEADGEDENGLYALAQNIFQFSIVDREGVYDSLQLGEGEKENLERLHDSDPAAFQTELKQCIYLFSKSISLKSDESLLTQIANHLNINLVLLKQEQGEVKIIQDVFSTATCYEWEHCCFRSEICIAVAKQKGLFKKADDKTIHIECGSQSAAIIREVYIEYGQIRKTILAVYQNQIKLQELNDTPYQQWYKKYLIEGQLDFQTALEVLSKGEMDTQNFSANYLQKELRNCPLAVIKIKTLHRQSENYKALDLKKLQHSAFIAYQTLSLYKS